MALARKITVHGDQAQQISHGMLSVADGGRNSEEVWEEGGNPASAFALFLIALTSKGHFEIELIDKNGARVDTAGGRTYGNHQTTNSQYVILAQIGVSPRAMTAQELGGYGAIGGWWVDPAQFSTGKLKVHVGGKITAPNGNNINATGYGAAVTGNGSFELEIPFAVADEESPFG